MASSPSFTFFCCYLLVVPLLVGFLFQQVYWCSHLPPTHLIFPCPLQFVLQSSYNMGYLWLFTLFLRRSTRCFIHAQGEVDSASTYLTTIFPFSYIFNLATAGEGKGPQEKKNPAHNPVSNFKLPELQDKKRVLRRKQCNPQPDLKI